MSVSQKFEKKWLNDLGIPLITFQRIQNENSSKYLHNLMPRSDIHNK